MAVNATLFPVDVKFGRYTKTWSTINADKESDMMNNTSLELSDNNDSSSLPSEVLLVVVVEVFTGDDKYAGWLSTRSYCEGPFAPLLRVTTIIK